ncbi:MAG: hypothetical protein AAGD32_11365 [Planctomycetota bacterium]
MDRAELEATYLRLVREVLPDAAKLRDWPIRFDHCFMRIVLDHLFDGCWYDHLSREQPAYRQLSDDQLRTAIRLAERIRDGDDAMLAAMNKQSLRWRGKLR